MVVVVAVWREGWTDTQWRLGGRKSGRTVGGKGEWQGRVRGAGFNTGTMAVA